MCLICSEGVFHFWCLVVTANSVYMTDMPPPYPGINAYNGYAAASAPPSGAVGFTQPPPAGSQSAAGKCHQH